MTLVPRRKFTRLMAALTFAGSRHCCGFVVHTDETRMDVLEEVRGFHETRERLRELHDIDVKARVLPLPTQNVVAKPINLGKDVLVLPDDRVDTHANDVFVIFAQHH